MKFSILTRCIVLIAAIMSMASCSTDDPEYNYVPPQVAYGIVANASPDSGNLYFFADDNAIYNPGINYNEAFGYYSFYPGSRVIKVKNQAGLTVATDTLDLEVGQVFSTFAVNRFADLELVTFQDSLQNPASGSARVRFINLTPDAPGITVYKSGVLVATLPFKTASPFLDIDVSYLSELTFKLVDSDEVLFTLSNGNFDQGHNYTVYTKGYIQPPTGSNDTFSTKVIRNY